jgi:branched-chain amino acid transport system ATP-binding protein
MGVEAAARGPAMTDILAVRDLDVRFGPIHAVRGISLAIAAARATALVGTNGAGKSTLFAVVSGQLDADAGRVSFGDADLAGLSPSRRARMGLGRTFQVPREFAHLTVRENFLVAGRRKYGETLSSVFFGWPRVRREEAALTERADAWIAFLNLAEVADRPAGTLSGGQKKLLELGRMLMLESKCILPDEPFAGVNPVLVAEISRRIRELNAERGIAFVIIEHNLEALKALATHLYVMDRGRVIAEGEPAQVLADPRVLEAYMGGVI